MSDTIRRGTPRRLQLAGATLGCAAILALAALPALAANAKPRVTHHHLSGQALSHRLLILKAETFDADAAQLEEVQSEIDDATDAQDGPDDGTVDQPEADQTDKPDATHQPDATHHPKATESPDTTDGPDETDGDNNDNNDQNDQGGDQGQHGDNSGDNGDNGDNGSSGGGGGGD